MRVCAMRPAHERALRAARRLTPAHLAQALPQCVDREGYDKVQTLYEAQVSSITFRRWPRDPERHPVKINMPLIPINEDKCPAVRRARAMMGCARSQ